MLVLDQPLFPAYRFYIQQWRNKMAELKVGDKYLSILVPFGGIDLQFVAFKNDDATPENKQPHYRLKGGGAIWIREKKEKKEEISL
jgi:hypothetical protein